MSVLTFQWTLLRSVLFCTILLERIFQRPLNVSPDFPLDIVKVCVVLYNFVRERERERERGRDREMVVSLRTLRQ
jgi:hypothetical protein